MQKPFQAKTPVSAFFTNMVTGKLSKDACVSDISLSNAYDIFKLLLCYISYHSRANLKFGDKYMINSQDTRLITNNILPIFLNAGLRVWKCCGRKIYLLPYVDFYAH